jgi:hypothetical protein
VWALYHEVSLILSFVNAVLYVLQRRGFTTNAESFSAGVANEQLDADQQHHHPALQLHIDVRRGEQPSHPAQLGLYVMGLFDALPNSLGSLDYILKRRVVPPQEKKANGRGLAIYVQSNCHVPSDRTRYVKELMKHIRMFPMDGPSHVPR